MIHVFGSINLDLVFTPPHLPAPGETVLCHSYEAFPGGKGANQAAAAARAGGNVRMIGCVGRDEFAALPLSALTQAGVDISGVERVGAATGCATISVAP
ncbi:MAG: PfkB family carbohydrate kinase, partial [Rhodospirillales bacterium]